MKGIDFFCASQASTAICFSMDPEASSSSSSTIHLGGRAIDRHNPIIRDGRRLTRALPSAPCSSEPPPINPKPYHQLHKPGNKKSSSSSKPNGNHPKNNSADKKKKSSSSKSLTDRTKKNHPNANEVAIYENCYSAMPASDIKKKSCAQLGDFITPPGSSRYLLSDSAFFDGLSGYESPDSKPEKPPSNQVVVLRVSLHCKGCEGKVRKHLSKMKGVKSFNIDFAAKKVTIVGDVTPLSVLSSVSKVKNAQFWPVAMPLPTSASAAVFGNNNREIKK